MTKGPIRLPGPAEAAAAPAAPATLKRKREDPVAAPTPVKVDRVVVKKEARPVAKLEKALARMAKRKAKQDRRKTVEGHVKKEGRR